MAKEPIKFERGIKPNVESLFQYLPFRKRRLQTDGEKFSVSPSVADDCVVVSPAVIYVANLALGICHGASSFFHVSVRDADTVTLASPSTPAPTNPRIQF